MSKVSRFTSIINVCYNFYSHSRGVRTNNKKVDLINNVQVYLLRNGLSVMYKIILVPHAGTPEGDIALKHAIDIARSHSSNIIILHVIEEFPHVPILGLHSSQITKIRQQITEMIREMKNTMEKQMTSQVKLCKKYGIDANLKVTVGLPAEEILKIVKSQKTDLIVMAKRRKLKGLKRLLILGSVSRKIVENTSCPVLLIDVEKKR